MNRFQHDKSYTPATGRPENSPEQAARTGQHDILAPRPASCRPSLQTPASARTPMSKQHKQIDAHDQATNEFIALANPLVDDRGLERNLVSAALMAASGVYATFIAAGNQGFLAENGVDKVAGIYKNNLAYIQKRKKEELEAQGLKPKPLAEVQSDATNPTATYHAQQ